MSPITKLASARSTIKSLKTLVEAGQLLHSTLDLNRILDLLLQCAEQNLKADRGTIYLLEKGKQELWARVLHGDKNIEIHLPIGHGIAGYVGKTGKVVSIRDAYKDNRFYKAIDAKSGFHTKTMLCMPMRNREGDIIGVFQILNKKKGYFTKHDERFLAALSVPASIAIENARLHLAEIEREKMERELEVAAAIQQQLLPQEIPSLDGIEVSAVSRPCRAVGGDFYDVIKGDHGTITLVIADVSGKGVAGALLVSTLQAALHTYLELGLAPVELVTKLNRIINAHTTQESFITFVLCMYDAGTRKLTYVNAGHNYPFVIRGAGGFTELDKGGLGLGMLPECRYEEGELTLATGDILLMYTDGVTEAMNRKQDLYGEARLCTMVASLAGRPVREIESGVSTDVERFASGQAQVDDFTMVLMKVD